MQSAQSLNVASQKHLSRAPSAGLLAFHAVLSIDILPTRLTGSGQPDCCCVFVAGVVFAVASGEDTNSAAPPRSKLSYGAIRWALAAIVLDDLSVSRVANHLDVAWHTANNAIINEGRRLLFNDSTRFDGVTVLGVDEHVWRHTRRGDKYVTIVVDLRYLST